MQDYVTGTTAAHQNQSTVNVTGTITANQHVESNQPAAADQPATRIRRTPSWMQDYDTGAIYSEEEETQNMVFYTTAGDPYTYEEASQSQK